MDEFIKLLSKQLADFRQLLKVSKNIKKYESQPLANLDRIKAAIQKLQKLRDECVLAENLKNKLDISLERIASRITEWEQELVKEFGQNLETELSKRGFELKGHYPLLKTSFYTLEVNTDKMEVTLWYGPQQEKFGTFNMSAEEIAKELDNIHRTITQRKFDDQVFLSKIYEAYRTCLSRKNKKSEEQIPISDILLEYTFLIQDKKFRTNPLKAYYKEYNRVFFSYDLHRLKSRSIDGKELNLITATRAYTRRRSDFLWVPSGAKGQGVYISHVKFKEKCHGK